MYFLISLLLVCTVSQMNIPINHKHFVEQHQQNRRNHHLYRNQTLRQPVRRFNLSHNLNYIRKHFGKPEQAVKNHRHHNLAHEVSNDQNLKLETFKLEPNTYSFSLPMKIAGLDYDMSIDSGSSDIFIKGQNAKGGPAKKYQCGQACIQNHPHYRLGYLDGQLLTYQTKLQVQLGDDIFNESILVAYQVEANFQSNQGLVGLSFPSLAENPNPSFIQTLKDQGLINLYAFGVNLNFQQKGRSFITFGAYDDQFFQGNLSFYPLTSNLFYYIESKGISFGNGELLKINTALFDTGNTCISIPIQYQQNILNQFNNGKGSRQNKCFFAVQENAQMFSVLRCKVGNFDNLPTLYIHLGQDIFLIEKEFYIQACDRKPADINLPNNLTQGFWYCDMYIETVKGMKQLFLGDGFFNRYYTYFDLQNKNVGIAKNNEQISLEQLVKNKITLTSDDWKDTLKKLDNNKSNNIKRH